MMNRFWARTSMILGVALGASLAGCGSEAPPCAASNMVWGVCAGVPADDVCGDDTCTEGVHCAPILPVGSDAELASAAAGAHAGACIALSPGHYAGVELPGGVSLLGRSSEDVTIDSVTMQAGDGAVVRGLAVGEGGVTVMGATGVRIESVRVSGGALIRDGISLNPGSSATIVTSTIEHAKRLGVFAKDADLTVDRSVVSGAQIGGIWAEGSTCDAACACSALPHLTVKQSAIRDNHVLGVSTRGIAADLDQVDVIGTQAGESFMAGQLGRGMSISACSELAAKHLRVTTSADVGVLVDNAKASLGGQNEGETAEISHNQRGLWVQGVCKGGGTSCVSLHNGDIADNLAVGIGVAGGSHGIILCRSTVSRTKSVTIPVIDEMGIGGTKAVGDGLNWLDGSEVNIEALTLSGNERQSLLIDGPASGMIFSAKLTGGDEGKPMLQQNLMMGGGQPTLGGGLSLAVQTDRKFAVPQPLSVLSQLP